MSFKDDEWNMMLALEMAEKAYTLDEVPIGAVVVDENGEVLAKSHNLKESVNDPCGHAEIIAIQKAAKAKGDWRLNNASIYVTLEPCPMCLSAMVHARMGRLIFGAYDGKGGAISLGYDFFKDKRLNHNFKVIGGVKHFESSKILSNFFREKRKKYSEKRDK